MLYSKLEIKDLLSEIVIRSSSSLTAAEKLIFYLKYPKEEVPALMAEIITNDPELIQNQTCLGSFIARGHVNELVVLRDLGLRSKSLVRISRQINRIAYFLQSNETPSLISNSYSDLLTPFYNLMMLLDKNNSEEILLAKKEIHLLFIEEAINAYDKEAELTKSLVEMLLLRLNSSQRINFAKDIISLITQVELNDDAENISKSTNIFTTQSLNQSLNLNQSLSLKPTLYELKSFKDSLEYFKKLAVDLTPANPNLIT